MKKTLSEKHRMKYLYIPLEEIHHTMGNNGGRADYGVTPVIATPAGEARLDALESRIAHLERKLDGR